MVGMATPSKTNGRPGGKRGPKPVWGSLAVSPRKIWIPDELWNEAARIAATRSLLAGRPSAVSTSRVIVEGFAASIKDGVFFAPNIVTSRTSRDTSEGAS